MAIIHKKIEKNLNPNLKCGMCSRSIGVGELFYTWVNNIPNLSQDHGQGGDICEDCYLKDQGIGSD